ncbi:right-handed parallel beta-helix repeat-containing protein [Candidatus Electronema sp. TJ]|uniref:right-handed parallel beta-helix repeat-containing protein n=1 Tax=Candidatus Electronema sp. TJ TaxID=3401573 RepID=UPI003AA93E59
MKRKIEMSRTALAFMSYVNEDNRHDNGWMTQFRERLSGEVRMHTGEPFDIFQDRKDIAWGQQWQERINQSLDAVTFLIPILTPAFFKSAACRDELERFLKREETLGRGDLILPVYYVNCPVLQDKVKREQDELAQVIAARQYADWRDLRFEEFTSLQCRKGFAKLAQQIATALEQRQEESSIATAARTADTDKQDSTESADSGKQNYAPPSPSPTAKNRRPTLVVAPLHQGDYATITDALKAAKPGARILVRPGSYREDIVIDKPVEIVGDGDRDEIVIEASGKYLILFKADNGRIANLTLRQFGVNQLCVHITQGKLEIEGCDIQACVVIRSEADALLRRNLIHGDGLTQFGVVMEAGTLEDNDIFDSTVAGVEIRKGIKAILRRNRIHDGKGGGVYFSPNSEGTLEDNDIFANEYAGVRIEKRSKPILRRNRIHDGKRIGILVAENCEGILEDNDIFANEGVGVEIVENSAPTLRRNRIHDGKGGGVLVAKTSQGTLEDNDIFANEYAGVIITEHSHPILRRNRISRNRKEGISVYGGGGTFEDNDLRGNAGGAWRIEDGCESWMQRRGNKE